MKYCTNCGTQLEDTAAFCTNCGNPVQTESNAVDPEVPVEENQNYAYVNAEQETPAVKEPSGLVKAAKILMIISTVVMGLYIIPLAWCLPILISFNKKIKNNEPITTGNKIVILLLVNTISGILLLCDKNN